MSEAVIEPATIEDLPQLTDLLIDLFSCEAEFKPDRIKQMRGLRLLLEQPNRGRIFVMRLNTTIVGMINLLFTISTAEGGFVLMLEDLVVHADYRNRGYGSRLMQHAVNYASEKDFLRITLLTDAIDPDSLRFYERHGFVESSMKPMRLLIPTRAPTV